MEGSVAQQSGSTLLRNLLTWRGATAGVAFIALSAVVTGLLGEKWAPVAIILAEIGAVLVAVFVIHFTYEHYVRASHLKDIKAALEAVFLEQTERAARFAAAGLTGVHYRLPPEHVRDLLGHAKKLKVLKTWFPDHPNIEAGLIEAVKNGAELKLLLSHPDSEVLRARSVSVYPRQPEHGRKSVVEAVNLMADLLQQYPKVACTIALYQGWPSSPIIWYDDHILLGFYFIGNASPMSPWLEVRPGSKLAGDLEEQFDALWRQKGTERLTNVAEMTTWLAKHQP